MSSREKFALTSVERRERQDRRIGQLRDAQVDVGQHGDGPLHVHIADTDVPGQYNLGVSRACTARRMLWKAATATNITRRPRRVVPPEDTRMRSGVPAAALHPHPDRIGGGHRAAAAAAPRRESGAEAGP